MIVVLSNAIAVAEHPERSGGSIPGGEGPGFRVLKIKVRFFVAALLRMTES